MDTSGLDHLLPQDAKLVADIRRRREEAAARRAAPARVDRPRALVAGFLYVAAAAMGLLMILHGLPRTDVRTVAGTATEITGRGALPVWIGFGVVLFGAGLSALVVLAGDLRSRPR